MAQDLGRSLAGGGARQPGDAGHVGDELGSSNVGRQAIVLGHVAHHLANRSRLPNRVHAEDRGGSACRGQKAQQDLEQRALACPVRADQADNAGLDGKVEPLKGPDLPVVLGQAGSLDQCHPGKLPPVRRGTIIATDRPLLAHVPAPAIALGRLPP